MIQRILRTKIIFRLKINTFVLCNMKYKQAKLIRFNHENNKIIGAIIPS